MKVVTDRMSAPYLSGATIDFVDTISQEGFTIEKTGRIVRPNTKPGLGITINEDEVRKHPFQQEILLREFGSDGSVTDW